MYTVPRHGVLPMTRRRRRIRTDDPCDQCTVRCCTFCCIGCVAVLLTLYLVLTSFLDMEAFAPIELVEFESLRTLTEISKRSGPAIDTEWLPILANASIARIDAFKSGLSPKYRVTFSTGHHAMLKFPEAISVSETSRHMIDWNDFGSKKLERDLSRADRLYQGWAELAAFHLDRVLGMYKKPPMIGRTITNRDLYIYDNGLATRVQRALPQYNIEVTMHAWMSELKTKSPSLFFLKYLTMQEDEINYTRDYALEVSDTLVFDFLVDDHDRKWDFNWKATASGQLLHWDSGLGWRHGPVGYESCLDILCGSTFWKESQISEGQNKKRKRNGPEPPCLRIKRFRASTIQKIKDMSSTSLLPHERLAAKWRRSLEQDPLAPVFDHGLFWDGSPNKLFRSRVRFLPENFYQGFEYRVVLLLNYVQECIDAYGREKVLLLD